LKKPLGRTSTSSGGGSLTLWARSFKIYRLLWAFGRRSDQERCENGGKDFERSFERKMETCAEIMGEWRLSGDVY
jgi:hypothetical protein